MAKNQAEATVELKAANDKLDVVVEHVKALLALAKDQGNLSPELEAELNRLGATVGVLESTDETTDPTI